MRSTTFAATAAFLSTLIAGQTFTDCNPLEKVCPADPALGRTLETDFRKGASDNWELADGTSITYDPNLGAEFVISKKTDAPTIGLDKYIMFGKVEAVMRASSGRGTVSSFILESGDLDEIDWEWLGADDATVQSNFFGKGNTTTYDRAIYHPVNDPIGSFHKYTIDWTAESLKWYIDGVLVRTLNYGDALALGGKNYPQTPMKVKMGNWIGCADEAAVTDPKTKGTCEWAGGAIDLNAGPYTMYVQSVTVEDYGCASEYTYSDMSGSWQSIVASGSCDGGKADTSSKASSSYASKTTSKPASSTTSAAILIETSNSLNSTTEATSTKSSAKPSSTGNTTITATTLTTASGSARITGTASSSGVAATTAPAQVSGNAGSSISPKKYGALDIIIIALGMGIGYIFM